MGANIIFKFFKKYFATPTFEKWVFVVFGIFVELISIFYLSDFLGKRINEFYLIFFLSLISWAVILFSSNFLFFLSSLVVLLVPYNRFLILRSDQAYLLGRISDYLLITLHLFEIPLYLFGILLLFKNLRNLRLKNLKNQKVNLVKNPAFLFVLLLFISISFLFFKNNFWFGFSRLQILLDFIILYFCLRKLSLRQITIFLTFSAVIQSLISILQVGRNHSAGLERIGESVFNSSLFFIAKSYIFNQLRVRAYGTFPHPNLLSGFIYVSLVLLFYWLIREISKNRRFKALSLRNIGRVGVISLLLMVIYLGQSRTVILSVVISLMIILTRFFLRNSFSAAKGLFMILVILFTVVSSLIIFRERIVSLASYDKTSFTNRVSLQKIAVDSVTATKFLGLGPNGYLKYLAENKGVLTNYSFIVEPAHNVFLLILSEYGVIVFTLFLAEVLIVIFKSFKYNINSEYFYIVLPIVIFLLLSLNLDHYLLTLKQGVFIFALCFRLLELKRVGGYENSKVRNSE